MVNKERTSAQAIGRAIRHKRTGSHLSLRTVAAKIGLTESHLSRLERGAVSANIDTLDAICDLLKIDLGKIEGFRSFRAEEAGE